MALHQVCHSFSTISFDKRVAFNPKPSCVSHSIKVISAAKMCNQTIVRRSGNYQPPTWKHEFIQSLRSEFMDEANIGQLNKLKGEVRVLMNKIIDDPLKQLELIDTLQRLGIAYHFKNEIKDMLKRTYEKGNENADWRNNNLYATSLEFRLLRQHGFTIQQDVFKNFISDETKSFELNLSEDLNGMLYLYEASFLSLEGEEILEEAKQFSKKILEKYMMRLTSKDENENEEGNIIRHALELPLHWRIVRMEARWFIDIYEKKVDMNPILLQFAKLDFNRVQSVHQEDLKYLSSWWKSTAFGEKLSFARNRIMENFFWSVAIRFEPEFSNYRRKGTKVHALLTSVDDVYDVYGTLDELQLFTEAIERWDIAAVDQLPDYMKICFFVVHNYTNEIAFEVLRDKGINVIQYLKKAWIDLCKTFMLEAKWYHSGYKPTLEEYLNMAWISVSGPVLLIHAYVLLTSPTIEDLESLTQYNDLICWSATIFRLANDLGTSLDEVARGDIPKSVQCYMNDTGASESDAREHVRHLIDVTWKKLNKIQVENSNFPPLFIESAKNIARSAQCIYLFGDGHGVGSQKFNDILKSLFIQPIPIHPLSE